MYSMYVGKITETQLTFKRFIFYEVQNTSKFTSVIIFYIHFCCPKTKKKMQILKSDVQHLTSITNISPPKLVDEMGFT